MESRISHTAPKRSYSIEDILFGRIQIDSPSRRGVRRKADDDGIPRRSSIRNRNDEQFTANSMI